MWTGLVWLRIGTGGEFLWIRYRTFGFHEMLGNYLVASRVVFSSIELVICTLILLTAISVLHCLEDWCGNTVNYSSSTAEEAGSLQCKPSQSFACTHQALYQTKLKLNSVAWVREWTVPTERPPLVGEISANFCESATWSSWLIPRPYSRFSRPEPLHFFFK
jgi:hypothetical protein